VAFHYQTSAACLCKFAYFSRQQGHAQTLMHPITDDVNVTHSFKVMVDLLSLRNGNVDAQVTNRHGRIELQRTVVAHKTHLQQCLADFCSLELVHGVHCPRWASLIVYLDEIVLCSSVAQSKQSSRSSLTRLLCCMLLHVPADWLHVPANWLHVPANRLHVPANRLHVPATWLHVPANWLHVRANRLHAVTLHSFDPKHVKHQHKQHQLMPL